METVSRQAQHLKKVCGKSNAEWNELSLAITELADAVETLDVDDHGLAISDHLLPLALELGELLRNIRSKLVSDVCEQLGRIVKTTGLAFTPLASALLEALASTAKASSVAIRNPGFQLFSDISQYSRYDLQSVQKVYSGSPQERVKSLVLEQLQIVLTYWPKDAIDPFYADMVEMMRRGMRDPSSHVRTACRETFCVFSEIWQERLAELVDIPTPPARDLLIKEKPHAAIAEAIRIKFNIHATPNRADAIRQRRAAVARRQAPDVAGEGDDSVFVEIKESPRRPMQRKATAEPTKRISSPTRGPPRSASPGSTTRSPTSSARAPTSTGRAASPSRAVGRGPSPSLVTRGKIAEAVTGRAASPGRNQLPSSAHKNAPGSETSVARVRNSDFDRDLNSTMLEEKAATATVVGPPTISDPPVPKRNSFLQMPVIRPRASSRVERISECVNGSTIGDTRRNLSKLSTASSSVSTSRFADAARNFVSRTQAVSVGDNGGFQEFDDAIADGDAASSCAIPRDAEFSVRGLKESLPSARLSDEVELERSAEDQNVVDSFFDQSIPDSASALAPRAPANVTQRDRRRNVDRQVTETLPEKTQNEYPFQPRNIPMHHVPAAPVAEHAHTVEELQRDLSHSAIEEEPPAVSIDSMFRTNMMASPTRDVINQSNAPASSDNQPHQDFLDDERDKENVRQPDYNADASASDALTNLNAIQEDVKNLRQTQLSREVGNLPRVVIEGHAPTETKKSAGQQDDEKLVTAQEQRWYPQVQQTIAQATEQHRDDLEADNQPPRPSPALAQRSMNVPTVQVQLKDRATPLMPPVSPVGYPDQTTLLKPVVPEHTPSQDLVRQSPDFTFMSAAPLIERVQMRQGRANSSAVDQTQLRQQQQTPDTMRFFYDGSIPPSEQQKSVSLPKLNMMAPTRVATGTPAAQNLSPHGTAQDNGGPSGGEPQNVPRQRPSVVLNDDLPVQPGYDTVPPMNSNASCAPDQSQAQASAPHRRPAVLNPTPGKIPVGVASKMLYSFCLVLGVVFGVSGLIQATTKVRDAYEYHNALLHRIGEFESNIVDSFESVRKMDEKYSVWSDYVRELTEQDKSTALHELESIQVEVEKWQTEMKNDLLAFKQSLSGDIIDAALADLRDPNATTDTATATLT